VTTTPICFEPDAAVSDGASEIDSSISDIAGGFHGETKF
jgi:hypothetical protein